MMKGMKFHSKNPAVLSYFQGFDLNPLEKIDFAVIDPFFQHVHEVIANNDEAVFNYIIDWISTIVQIPDAKTETAIVITGIQGTGKNLFTNVVCDMVSPYCTRNMTNIDSIIGKFNSSIENKKLIILNEFMSADTNKYLNSDALKSVITDRTIVINTKNVAERIAENVANLIMCSNNMAPIRIDEGDRRYVVTQSSPIYKGNACYFTKLFDLSQTEEFRKNLFTYFMTKKLDHFDSRKIPMTQAKKDIMDASRSAYEMFIQDNLQKFIDGWLSENCYESYKDWAKNHGYAICNSSNFGKNIKPWCDHKQIRYQGKRPYQYKIKPDQLKKFEIPPTEEEIDENDFL
jgi:hypothetical protein